MLYYLNGIRELKQSFSVVLKQSGAKFKAANKTAT